MYAKKCTGGNSRTYWIKRISLFPVPLNLYQVPTIAVLYWPSTQLHHLVTHSWANWIKFTFSFISQVYFATKISTTILNSVNVQGWFERAGKCEWGSLSPNAIWSQNPGEIEKEKSPTLNFSNRPWRLKVAICRSKSNQNDEYRYWY